MQFANAFYNTIAKRNSVYVASIFAGAFTFGIGFDVGVTSFWDSWNKGVSGSHFIYLSYAHVGLCSVGRNNGRISVKNT